MTNRNTFFGGEVGGGGINDLNLKNISFMNF